MCGQSGVLPYTAFVLNSWSLTGLELTNGKGCLGSQPMVSASILLGVVPHLAFPLGLRG